MSVTCSPKLYRLGKNSRKSKLMATFSGQLPAYVRVKSSGTSDTQPLSRCNQGNWVSKKKYSTLEQTLQLLDNNKALLKECNYDIDGNPVIDQPVNAAVFFDVDATITGSGNAITWIMATEQNVETYVIFRSSDNGTNYSQIGQVPFDDARDQDYADPVPFVDSNPPAGALLYRVTVRFDDGSTVDSASVAPVAAA